MMDPWFRPRWGALARLAIVAVGAAGLVATPVRAASAAVPCVAPAIGDPSGGVGGGFTAITPARLLDTRTGQGGVTGPVGAGCVARVSLASVVGPSATGVAATVTLTDAEGDGFATAYPCGSARPYVSNVNSRADSPVPNLVVAPVDSTRELCIFTSVITQVIVDVTGWFGSAGGQFHELTPTRALDTRVAADSSEAPPIAADTVVQLSMTPWVPAYATAIAVNVTVTPPAATGFATVYPCGTPTPLASNVNFIAGEDRAAQAMVGLGNGSLCVYLSADAHVIVDLWGWFGGGDGALIVPTKATRLIDSRTGEGSWTVPVGAGETRAFNVPPFPGWVRSVVVDIVAVGAEGSGYLTLFPCGTSQPATSSVNYVALRAMMNLVTVPVGIDGRVCVYSSARTDVIVDLLGFADNPGPLRSISVSPKALTTNFVPSGRDYAIVCDAGTTRVTVTVGSLPGYTIVIGAASALNRLATSIDVSPNSLIQIEVRQGLTAVDQYYIRCLPPDFPAIHTIAYGFTTPGWYMVTPATFAAGSHYAVILDERGVPLWHRKATTSVLDLEHFNSLEVAPNGDYIVSARHMDAVFRIDHTTGTIAWKLGGNPVNKDGAPSLQILNDPLGGPKRTHDARLLADGSISL